MGAWAWLGNGWGETLPRTQDRRVPLLAMRVAAPSDRNPGELVKAVVGTSGGKGLGRGRGDT